MFELTGKRALITGGTRGLGRAIALRFARAGATLALNFRRDESSAAETLGEIQKLSSASFLVRADLESDAEVRAMVAEAAERMGGLDIFVANAAATAFKPLLEARPHNLQRTFNLSVGSFVAAVQEASKHMGTGGRIVVISGTDAARFMPGHGTLGAAKAALETMVHYFAFELGPRGITVNGVNTGLFDTASSRFYLKEDFERAARVASERSALKRLPELDELAAVVQFLCAPEASFVTGHTMWVDGGLMLASPLSP